ncbi:MAG: hypothetical protein JO157_01605 [Acetobacteraceae bacterium]|nr:hypothetical protein [Acetobacteraceae bacterium]
MARLTVDPEQARSVFLAALAESANVSKAAKAARIGRATAYEWRAADEAFAQAWDAAIGLGLSALEDEAHRCAHDGWDEPVFYKGAQCGVVRRYSDAMLMFILRSRRREVYGERAQVDVNVTETLGAALAAARARVRGESA